MVYGLFLVIELKHFRCIKPRKLFIFIRGVYLFLFLFVYDESSFEMKTYYVIFVDTFCPNVGFSFDCFVRNYYTYKCWLLWAET